VDKFSTALDRCIDKDEIAFYRTRIISIEAQLNKKEEQVIKYQEQVIKYQDRLALKEAQLIARKEEERKKLQEQGFPLFFLTFLSHFHSSLSSAQRSSTDRS
jgi:hypothetical protein